MLRGTLKYLPVERVIELLKQLPPNTLIIPNYVQNLSLGDSEHNYKGYIDFIADGTIEGDYENYVPESITIDELDGSEDIQFPEGELERLLSN